MTAAEEVENRPPFAEDIRLVIWDLDETFWHGTLSEDGIRYRMDCHDIVIELARRGIISSICSKNAHENVERLLREKGLWDYFVFPSIDWTAKGPRLRAMLQQFGLRPASVLFIDDNLLNLAQAQHMNPGLNVAGPAVIGELLDLPQTRGKDDEELSRLAQYKLKERKADAIADNGEEELDFLRRSGIRVFLEYDVEAHIDRAVELINRTNQLNFTKNRLPEDPDLARRALTEALAHNTTDAALIRVRDDFGDYGYAGFYMTRRINNTRRLQHFCFSCRTLNMFIEHWTYAHLGRPALNVMGEVLTDPTDRDILVDWITPARVEATGLAQAAEPLQFQTIFARGGCDLASLMHYFTLHSDTIIEEFNEPRNGQMFRRDHTAFLMPALTGKITKDAMRAAETLGYDATDFETRLPDATGGLTLLSFWADADIPEYRHRQTSLRVPYWLVGAQQHDLIANGELREAVARTDVQRTRVQALCERFEHRGILSERAMRQRYRRILDAVPASNVVVVVLANERGPQHFLNPSLGAHPSHARLNRVIREVAAGCENVLLLDPADHINGPDDLIDLNHFKRPVYHRMYRDVIARLAGRGDDG